MKLDVVRDILDKQLHDMSGQGMGRADGVVIAVEDGGQPFVDHLELGATVLAKRLGGPADRLVAWVRRKWPVRKEAVQSVPWERVAEITNVAMKIDVDAEATPAFDWERWLREHVVGKIPGSTK